MDAYDSQAGESREWDTLYWFQTVLGALFVLALIAGLAIGVYVLRGDGIGV